MRAYRSLDSLSLKTKLIFGYLGILVIGGLAVSLISSSIVSSTVMDQARQKVDHDLKTARSIYNQLLASLSCTVKLSASGTTVSQHLSADDQNSLLAFLESTRKDSACDFLTLTDSNGRVILRTSAPDRTMDDVSSWPVISAALAGECAEATEILSAEQLYNENPAFCEQARFQLIHTPRAGPVTKAEETAGLVLISAAPVRGSDGKILGALYGGILLNRNFRIVDRVWELVYGGDKFKDQNIGSVTIFQQDLRISTNVRMENGDRALGTRVSEEVSQAVLSRGETWRDRAFVVHDWYLSAYEPIRNYCGEVVGILYVGVLEVAYTSIRNHVIFSFFAIATIGFIVIAVITYYMIGTTTRPLRDMVAATHRIADGKFDQEVHAESHDEFGQLATSFNRMLKSLKQQKVDLEEWGRILEERVEERTAALTEMQTQIIQSEKLASVGQLAAGVAHEINNPLGGILALTALSLEDMEEDDPNRENLEEVVQQAVRCRDIVKSLVTFSRQAEVKTEPLNLNKIMEHVLSLLEIQPNFRNILVIRHLAPELPPVLGSNSQFQQVLMNIIVNAAQAMEEKGTIEITTNHDIDDGFVEVLISDTGCGIPPDEIEHIFDPFFTTKPTGEGTGLGLSIAHGIITRQMGTISVESQVGSGTTFAIRMPASEERGDDVGGI